MEKKFFNNSLAKNIAFGLAWLFWPVAVVMHIIDKDVLDLDEKRTLVSIYVCMVASMVLAFTIVGSIVSLVISVFMIIAAIKAFMGQDFKVPLAYTLAEKIVK